MSKHAKTIINTIIGSVPNGNGRVRYLEVGPGSYGHTFWEINCEQKTAVDVIKRETLKTVPEIGPQGGKNMSRAKEYYDCGSDVFFKEHAINKRWDIVFIDGDHEYSQVVKDVNNALYYAAIVLVHDLIPPNGSLAQNHPTIKGLWCGDGFKLLYYMREINAEHFSLNEDYGLTMFSNPPNTRLAPEERYKDVTFKDFLEQRTRFAEYNLRGMIMTAKEISKRIS